jgi:hypothetical protein
VLLLNEETEQFACLNFGHMGGVCSNSINVGIPSMSWTENTAPGMFRLAVHANCRTPEGKYVIGLVHPSLLS